MVRVHRLDETSETWYPLGGDLLGDLVYFRGRKQQRDYHDNPNRRILSRPLRRWVCTNCWV
jgi:hypothetical protein